MINVEDRLTKIFKDILMLETLDCNISQQNHDKWDSMQHLNLIMAIEESFNISIEPEEISDFTSYAKILLALQEKHSQKLS